MANHPPPAATTVYIALRANPPGGEGYIWHLGSNTLGSRVYCGVLLIGERVTSDRLEAVTCNMCRKTAAWHYANARS